MDVLVLNSGSSSIKYQLFDMSSGIAIASGSIEKIGEASHVPDHRAGLRQIMQSLAQAGVLRETSRLFGIGHRVVHGGAFARPMRIDAAVIDEIRKTIPLAPLHNGPNLAGIELARELFPAVPQVAVFDTAFHQTLPPHAYTYPLPRDLSEKHHIRRYGFHGTSHRYVAAQAAKHLGQPLDALALITLHLGNGASATAIRAGESVDTSMGMTPLEGLMMGTRCGDIDPEIPLYLQRECGLNAREVETLLNSQSGLKGICGINDMREVQSLAEKGNANAKLAIDVFCYRIKKYIGAYIAVLGKLDALIFTAGIGEHSAFIRSRCCSGLGVFGIAINEALNAQPSNGIRHIQTADSQVRVLVVPTNEELEIARMTLDCIRSDTRS
jgi:acetate kinase